jgi:4-hydroxy-tetrahydrodipicolinate synthase
MKRSRRAEFAAPEGAEATERGEKPMTVSAVDASRDSAGVRVTGVVPPIPTPFADGRVDLASLERMLDHLAPSVDGVLVGGSTGEAPSLSVEERIDVMRAVRATLGSDRALAVSVADNSLEHTRRLADAAAECEADLLVVSCPGYFPNDRSMLLAYFDAVAGLTAIDLCLYDNPVASNTHLAVDDVVALVDSVPRLTHVKMTDTALGKVGAVRAATTVTVHAGEDTVLWHQLTSGAEGVMTAVPLVFPERSAGMWRAFRDGRADDAHAAYAELASFILCGLNAGDYPAVVKAVLHERGVIASPEVRLPLLPLSPARRAEVLAACRRPG